MRWRGGAKKEVDFYCKMVYLIGMSIRKQLNLPNVLSLIRIGLLPVIFYLILKSNRGNYPYLIFVYCFAVLLDFLDGFFARKLNQETELGKILDPIADKLLILLVILAMIIRSDFPIWLGVFILVRDLLILVAGVTLMKKKHKVTASVLIGKVAFSAFGAMLLMYIIDLHPSLNLYHLKQFFIVISVGFLAWSLVEYFNIYLRERKKCA